jgi:hypothetical protein
VEGEVNKFSLLMLCGGWLAMNVTDIGGTFFISNPPHEAAQFLRRLQSFWTFYPPYQIKIPGCTWMDAKKI